MFAADAYGISPCVVNTISIVLLAGRVQNTSFVPAEKSTAESELELEITAVLVKFALAMAVAL